MINLPHRDRCYGLHQVSMCACVRVLMRGASDLVRSHQLSTVSTFSNVFAGACQLPAMHEGAVSVQTQISYQFTFGKDIGAKMAFDIPNRPTALINDRNRFILKCEKRYLSKDKWLIKKHFYLSHVFIKFTESSRLHIQGCHSHKISKFPDFSQTFP